MSLSDLFLFFFACYGITFILMYSEIMEILKIRSFLIRCDFFKKLLSCSFCTSFYVAVTITSVYNLPWIFVFSASAFVFMLDHFIDYLISNSKHK